MPPKKLSFSFLGESVSDFGAVSSTAGAAVVAGRAVSAKTGEAGDSMVVSVVGSGMTGGSAETTVSFGGTIGATSLSFFSWAGLRTFSKKLPKMLDLLVALGLAASSLGASTTAAVSVAGSTTAVSSVGASMARAASGRY